MGEKSRVMRGKAAEAERPPERRWRETIRDIGRNRDVENCGDGDGVGREGRKGRRKGRQGEGWAEGDGECQKDK